MLIGESTLFLAGEEKKAEDEQSDEKSDLSEEHEKNAEERQQRCGGYEERCLSHLSWRCAGKTCLSGSASSLEKEQSGQKDDDDAYHCRDQFHGDSLSGMPGKGKMTAKCQPSRLLLKFCSYLI